jgi:serine/threonine protein kinase
VLPAHLFARPRAAAGRRGEEGGARRVRAQAEPAGAELGVGAILDKYRIEEPLGVGGFAVVYRATHMLLRTQVAIKMLRPQLLRRKPELASALCQEARFAARIDHPNVVRVYDVTHGPEITYVVMEYVEGSTLAKAIRARGPLPARTVVRVGLDVAAGLQAGQEQGLVHRDIKPANIIITPQGRAKIVDLGLASTIAGSTLEPTGVHPGAAALVGTPGYMPPELAQRPQGADFRGDIYALGVTLYQAAVGRLPFPADDATRCLQMHATEPIPHPRALRPDLPDRLSDVLVRMLSKRPADRPPSYDVLRGALKRVLEVLPSTPTTDSNDD